MKTAANVHLTQGKLNADPSTTITLTAHQLEQLLKSIPSTFGSTKIGTETDDELDPSYAGMVSCHCAFSSLEDWIIDSGASDHMCANLNNMFDVKDAHNKPKVNLPNGQVTYVSHIGCVKLQNGIILKNVLFVPDFKQNLLSVEKLTKDSKCKVVFHANFCVIQDCTTQIIKGIGRAYRACITSSTSQ